MVERRNRRTDESFPGCSRFPACRGTRPLDLPRAAVQRTARPTRARIRLSSGRREARGAGDYAELIVARLVGRSLMPIQGLLAQIAGVILLEAAFYWFLASGTMAQVITPIADWYASNAMHPFAVTPSPR